MQISRIEIKVLDALADRLGAEAAGGPCGPPRAAGGQTPWALALYSGQGLTLLMCVSVL